MIFVNTTDKKIIDYSEARDNKKKNIILLNPAEYFIYQTSKKNKLSPEEVCYKLSNADRFVRYSRLGELISSFFAVFDNLFCGMDEDMFRKIFGRNIVFKVPFSEPDMERINCVLWSVFSDLGDIVVEDAKIELALKRNNYSIKDIKNLILDRFYFELYCGEDEEDLYNKYIDDDKHSLIREAEKVIWDAEYPINKFITDNFDLKIIKRRIHNL